MVQVYKSKRYVDSPAEAPEGAQVQQGPQGGLYYETSSVQASLSGSLLGLAWDDPNGRSFTVVDQTAGGDWVLIRDDGKVYDGVPRADVVALAEAGEVTQAPDEADDPGLDYVGAEWVSRGEVYRVQRSVGTGLYEVKNLSTGAVEVVPEAEVDEALSIEDDDGDGVPNDLVGESFSVGGKQFTVLDVDRSGMALVRGPGGDVEVPEDQLRTTLQSGRVEIVPKSAMRYEDLIEKGRPSDFAGLYDGAGVSVLARVEERGNEFVKVNFTLTDPASGRDVAKMVRSFNSDGSVEHDTFIIAPEFQGRGMAASVNERAEEAYRAAGFSSIYMTADIDVGKYTWALQGYDFETEDGRDWMRARLKRFLSTGSRATQPTAGTKFTTTSGDGEILGLEGQNYIISVGEDRSVVGPEGMRAMLANSDDARYEKLAAENGGFEHSWDFAGLDDGEQYDWKTDSKSGKGHLGKAFLLSNYVHEWDGRKSLQEGDLGYAIGQRYYQRGKKSNA